MATQSDTIDRTASHFVAYLFDQYKGNSHICRG